MTLLSLAPLRRPKPALVCAAGDAAATDALASSAGSAASAAAGHDEAGDVRACGWFDSSWELRQGLAVNELPEAELAVAALWFAELLPVVLPASALGSSQRGCSETSPGPAAPAGCSRSVPGGCRRSMAGAGTRSAREAGCRRSRCR